MQNRTLKLGVTGAILAAGIGLLIYSSLADAEYYKMVDEAMAEPDKWTDKTMRIHGYVEPGSIRERIEDQQMKRTFVLEKEGKRILVRHHGPVPDSFRDMSEIVARGKMLKEGGQFIFEAKELTAKCPSKYEGEAAPNADPGGSRAGNNRPLF